MTKRIVITIDEDGDLKFETFGWDTPDCIKDIEWLTKELGANERTGLVKKACVKSVKNDQKAYRTA